MQEKWSPPLTFPTLVTDCDNGRGPSPSPLRVLIKLLRSRITVLSFIFVSFSRSDSPRDDDKRRQTKEITQCRAMFSSRITHCKLPASTNRKCARDALIQHLLKHCRNGKKPESDRSKSDTKLIFWSLRSLSGFMKMIFFSLFAQPPPENLPLY